jgi:transcriptional regulator with XRE-family HTH domain
MKTSEEFGKVSGKVLGACTQGWSMVVQPDIRRSVRSSRWSREAGESQEGGPVAADSDHPSLPAHGLAERLRDLREQEFRQLTQRQLARALGGSEALSVATISHWEKPGSDRLPPPQRLATYARLFCTDRSFASGAPQLLRDDELTEQERERETELYDELIALRERAQSTDAATAPDEQPSLERRSSIWQFPDMLAVSIVCSDAPDPPPYADPSHLNYSRYARHADIDTLVDVFGQIKAENPASMIRILSPGELGNDFALNHLVLIGGAALDAAYFAQNIPLPVPRPLGETYIFACKVGEEEREFASVREDGALMEDVGLIARVPHPIVSESTVTVLSGITSRGVHGAALCFTDVHVRDENVQYLEQAFGSADTFCVLMRVPVRGSMALPPNLGRENTCLYEWSAETGARWGLTQ